MHYMKRLESDLTKAIDRKADYVRFMDGCEPTSMDRRELDKLDRAIEEAKNQIKYAVR